MSAEATAARRRQRHRVTEANNLAANDLERHLQHQLGLHGPVYTFFRAGDLNTLPWSSVVVLLPQAHERDALGGAEIRAEGCPPPPPLLAAPPIPAS
jgi:hypothetical protein